MSDNQFAELVIAGVRVKPVAGWSWSERVRLPDASPSAKVEFGGFDHEFGYGQSLVSRQFALDFLGGKARIVVPMRGTKNFGVQCDSIPCSLVFQVASQADSFGTREMQLIGQCSGRRSEFRVSPEGTWYWWTWGVVHPLTEVEVKAVASATDLT